MLPSKVRRHRQPACVLVEVKRSGRHASALCALLEGADE